MITHEQFFGYSFKCKMECKHNIVSYLDIAVSTSNVSNMKFDVRLLARLKCYVGKV